MSYLRTPARCFTALAVLTFACTITPSAPGLKLHSELVKNQYILGEPIYLTVVLENTGESAVTVPGGVTNRFLTIRIAYENGFAPYHGPLESSLVMGVRTKKEFLGGAKDAHTYKLTAMYSLWTVGRYEIEAVFAGNRDEYKDAHGKFVEDADTIWAGEIRAPKLVIELQEPQGVDREALEFLKPRISEDYGNKDINVYLRVFSYRYYQFTRELRDKYPSSLYTAYALCVKHHIDLGEPMPENPKPEEVLRSFEETRLNPPNEYFRSVRPKEQKQRIADLWLIVKHHPEFAFIDRVYEVMGFAHLSGGNHVQAQTMFEKATGATKDAKRKERMGAFVEALKGRADKPERAAEAGAGD